LKKKHKNNKKCKTQTIPNNNINLIFQNVQKELREYLNSYLTLTCDLTEAPELDPFDWIIIGKESDILFPICFKRIIVEKNIDTKHINEISQKELLEEKYLMWDIFYRSLKRKTIIKTTIINKDSSLNPDKISFDLRISILAYPEENKVGVKFITLGEVYGLVTGRFFHYSTKTLFEILDNQNVPFYLKNNLEIKNNNIGFYLHWLNTVFSENINQQNDELLKPALLFVIHNILYSLQKSQWLVIAVVILKKNGFLSSNDFNILYEHCFKLIFTSKQFPFDSTYDDISALLQEKPNPLESLRTIKLNKVSNNNQLILLYNILSHFQFKVKQKFQYKLSLDILDFCKSIKIDDTVEHHNNYSNMINFRQATIYEHFGDNNKALSLLNLLKSDVFTNRDKITYYNKLGNISFDTGEYEMAITHYIKCLSIIESDLDPCNLYALVASDTIKLLLYISDNYNKPNHSEYEKTKVYQTFKDRMYDDMFIYISLYEYLFANCDTIKNTGLVETFTKLTADLSEKYNNSDFRVYKYLLKIPAIWNDKTLFAVINRILSWYQQIISKNASEDIRLLVKKKIYPLIELVCARLHEINNGNEYIVTLLNIYNTMALTSSVELANVFNSSVILDNNGLTKTINENNKWRLFGVEANKQKIDEYSKLYEELFNNGKADKFTNKFDYFVKQLQLKKYSIDSSKLYILFEYSQYSKGIFIFSNEANKYFNSNLEPLIKLGSEFDSIINIFFKNYDYRPLAIQEVNQNLKNCIIKLTDIFKGDLETYGISLSDYKEVCLIVPEELSNIPFHTMPIIDKKIGAVTYSSGLLVAKSNVNGYIKQISVLNAGYGLQNAEIEKNCIFEIHKNTNKEIIEIEPTNKKEIILSNVKETQCFHFIGHASYNEDYPLLSMLHIDEDNMARNISPLDIALCDFSKSELIYISACESNPSTSKNAGELLGFPRSFLIAGAKNYLGTRYPIDDVTATMFAESFYHHLNEVNIIEKAFVLAQQECSEKGNILSLVSYSLLRNII